MTNSPRRRHQFSLRTLLSAMLALSLPLAWHAHSLQRELAAVAQIEQLGGSCEMRPRSPQWFWSRIRGRQANTVSAVNVPVENLEAAMIYLQALPELTSIDLYVGTDFWTGRVRQRLHLAKSRIQQELPDVRLRTLVSLCTMPTGRIEIVEEQEPLLGVLVATPPTCSKPPESEQP